MAITQVRGNTQLKDATVTVAKLATQDGASWTIAGDNLGIIDGLGNPTGNNQAANKAYVDGLVNTTMKAPDGYATDSSGNYPSDYKGTGTVVEGDTFYITSVANGTAVGAVQVNVGDSLVALVDAPGNTDANWVVMESNRDQATETVRGVARIATAAEVTTGTDDTTIVTPLKLASAISDASTTAGAGLTDTNGTYDVVAADLSLVINADDMAVNIGTTNGTSLEVSATGLELASTVTGARTLSAGAGNSITLDTDANLSALTAQPDGTVDLAIATTKYVNDAVGGASVYNETPTVTNGSADVTIANAQLAGSERVYLNGLRMVPGSSNDYTVSGQTITFTFNLQSGDVVVVDYKLV